MEGKEHVKTPLLRGLKRLKVHDHLCLIYETPQEWEAAIVPFTTIGLERGEKCCYFADVHTAEQLRGYLQAEGVDDASAEASGQLVILCESEAYTKEGSFDPDLIISLLITETEKAIAEGYPALRLTGEMTWALHGLPGSERLLEYEAKLNRDFYSKYPALGICQYDRWKFDPEIIKGVVMTHPFLVRGNYIHHNFYYIPTDEFLNAKRAELEAQHWLNNLERERIREQELRDSEEKFSKAFNTNPTPMTISTLADGRYIDVNGSFLRITGYSREEIISHTSIEIGIWAKLDSRARMLKMMRDQGKIHNSEYEFRMKSGEVRLGLLSVETISFGGQQCFLSTTDDITERKQAEDALKAASAQWSTTFDAIGEAVCLLDNQNKILRCNHAMEKLIGKPSNEIVGQTCWKLIHGTSSPVKGCPIVRMKKTRQREIMPLSIGSRYFQVTVDPILDKDGNLAGAVHIIANITERKQTEEELQLRAQLLNNATDFIFLRDLDENFVYANETALKALGYSQEEFLKLKVHQTIAPGYPYTKASLLKELMAKGTVTFETCSLCKDGSIIPVEAHVRFIEMGDKELILSTVRDITERKQLEEERQKVDKLESVGTLAGGIAHDFNNLLTGIMGNIGLAARYVEPKGKASERLDEAEKACVRARDLTQQLLTFARGGLPVKKLASVAEIVKESAVFSLSGSGVRPEFSLPDDLWMVEIDEGQMSQVIRNIVVNADEAMPNGGIIKIRAKNRVIKKAGALPLPNGNYIEISIEDHGVGIPKEHLPRIFDPYFTTKKKGSGLGLATAYSIIKNHGGYITVVSTQNVGTTFHIYLPAFKKPAPIKEKEALREAPIHHSKGRILVMDDEETVREFLHAGLTEIGYDVELTNDGKEAINRYAEAKESGQPFDALIMDLTIPGGMGGKEAIKHLLEIDPDTKVIVSSGYSTDPVMANYKEYGFSTAVAKPYRVGELEKTLHKLLKTSTGSMPSLRKRKTTKASAVGSKRVLIMEDSEVVKRAISENLPDFGYEVEFAHEGSETISKYKESMERGQIFDAVVIDLTVYEGLGGEETIKELLTIDQNVTAVVTSGYPTKGPMLKPEKYGFKAAIAKPFGIEELDQIISSVLKKRTKIYITPRLVAKTTK